MGTLYLVSTPIGNLEDITIRAIRILGTVPIIVCEDTRRTGILLNALSKSQGKKESEEKKERKLISYYDEIEETKTPEIMRMLEQGNDVAVVCDAGTPLVSDPGYKLVRTCHERNIPVVSVPGACAPIAALTLSGFPPQPFLFLGYLPKSLKKRRDVLMDLAQLSEKTHAIHPTVLFFESPYRIVQSLQSLHGVFGDIKVSVARELTKMHEEVIRGKISDILANKKEWKGEIVVLFSLHPDYLRSG